MYKSSFDHSVIDYTYWKGIQSTFCINQEYKIEAIRYKISN